MNLVKANYSILEPSFDFKKDIELIARTCYKSENNIKENSAEDFIKNVLINNKHLAMCEHGTIYLIIPCYMLKVILFYKRNKYSVCKIIKEKAYITTNYRVILDNNRNKDLKYQSKFTLYHERRISVKFITDRGVSHEFVRNRGEEGTGFGQESTRYCNYLKEKFGMSVTFIQPNWILEEEKNEFEEDLKTIERIYFKWLNKGWKAQQARGFLCHFTKTELWITATMHDWCHFLFLRADNKAHPQAQELAYPLKEEFIKRNWIKEQDIRY